MANPAEEGPHLLIPTIPSEEQAKKEVDAALAAEQPSGPDVDDDPKAAEEYTFAIEVKDGSGRVWKGQFTNHILSYEEMLKVGMLKSRYLGGFPFASLDPETLDLAEKMAHLTVSLTKKPGWWVLSGKGALKNARILNAVYQEVAAHEAYFRGSEEDPPSS